MLLVITAVMTRSKVFSGSFMRHPEHIFTRRLVEV